jgi:hypothetical protein
LVATAQNLTMSVQNATKAEKNLAASRRKATMERHRRGR